MIAALGTLIAVLFVRDTGRACGRGACPRAVKARSFRSAFARGTVRDPVLRACSQAGLVNNLNDALRLGLALSIFAANGASVTEVGIVAGIYPAVRGAGQLATGWLSDHTGRKPLIVLGMLVQAGAPRLLVVEAATCVDLEGQLLGAGTALVYPTLIAAVSDVAQPVERAQLVGVYRFWRDFGFVVGAVIAGVVADELGASWAIAFVAALTAASGLGRAGLPAGHPRPARRSVHDLLADARERISPRLDPEEAQMRWRTGHSSSISARRTSGARTESCCDLCTFRARCWNGASIPTRYANPYISGLDCRLILCAEGFSSSFAAASLREWAVASDRHDRRLRGVEGSRPARTFAGRGARSSPDELRHGRS